MFKFCIPTFFAFLSISVADNFNRLQSAEPGTPEQPNLLFILVDDLGWGDLGVFFQNQSAHNRTHKTPHLDRMAEQGLQMRAHYCPAPVCAPSRSSLLTGVHQGHAEIRDNQFDKRLENNHTLGTVMQSAGYRTAMIGKYGLQGKGKSSDTWPAYPTKRGFDEFFGLVRHVDGHLHYPANRWPLGNSESHQTPKEVWWNDREVSGDLQKCYTTDLFTARSKQWIVDHRDQHPDQPFFLMLNYDTPHAALQVPTCAYPTGQGVNGGLQWTGKPGAMINTATGEIDSWRHPDYANQGWSDVEERFATMVRRIDNCVGDLLQTLKDLEIDQNTIVIFTSDNGPHRESYLAGKNYAPTSFKSYGPFEGIKRDCWEGGIRMPTLAWGPSQIPGGRIDNQPSQFHDWMPTLAQLGGTTAPARSDGVSLIPTLTGQGEQLTGKVYIEYVNNRPTPKYQDFLPARRGKKRKQMQVLFLDGYKGIRVNIKSHADPFEIYDVANDPDEAHNLAGTNKKFKHLQQQMLNTVLRQRTVNKSARRPYDNEPIPGLKDSQNADGEQRHWDARYGKFACVPQFSTAQSKQLEMDQSGKADVTDNGKIQVTVDELAAVQFTRWIHLDRSQEIGFTFATPTRAFARLHDLALSDADFGYQSGAKLETRLKLGAGWHPIRITVLSDKSNHATCTLKVHKQTESQDE